MMRRKNLILPFLLVVALVPLISGNFGITVATEIVIAGIFVTGVNLLLGYTGLTPLGNAMFLGLGAYSYSIAEKLLGWPVWISFPAAVVFVAALAFVIGLICTRTREIEFLLITLAFCQMFYGAAVKSHITGGTDGMTGISRPDLSWMGLEIDSPTTFYLYALCIAAVMLVFFWALIRSPFGSVLVGIRENENRVKALGYSTKYYKVISFVVAGVFAATAGVLTAQYSYFVNPEMMTWQVGGEAVLMVIIGGRKYLLGAFAGAAIFILMKQALSTVSDNYLVFFGLFFMLVVVFLKDGVLGIADHFWSKNDDLQRATNT